jgi:hypothetical protein
MLGEKNGGKKGVWMGEKKWPAACWVGETKERKGKQNKTKEKAGRLLVVGWGERREREREREKKRKKKRPAASYLAGWEKKKKKACCVPAGWVGERKGGDEKKNKNKNPVVTFQKVKRYQWSPKIKNFNVIPNLIV